jgi:hypothetical protein
MLVEEIPNLSSSIFNLLKSATESLSSHSRGTSASESFNDYSAKYHQWCEVYFDTPRVYRYAEKVTTILPNLKAALSKVAVQVSDPSTNTAVLGVFAASNSVPEDYSALERVDRAATRKELANQLKQKSHRFSNTQRDQHIKDMIHDLAAISTNIKKLHDMAIQLSFLRSRAALHGRAADGDTSERTRKNVRFQD